MKRKRKYILVTLQERNGEKEYTHKVVMTVGSITTPEKLADSYASNFWGEDGKKNEDGWWEFEGGSIWVRVREVTPITEKEFEVLNKFM